MPQMSMCSYEDLRSLSPQACSSLARPSAGGVILASTACSREFSSLLAREKGGLCLADCLLSCSGRCFRRSSANSGDKLWLLGDFGFRRKTIISKMMPTKAGPSAIIRASSDQAVVNPRIVSVDIESLGADHGNFIEVPLEAEQSSEKESPGWLDAHRPRFQQSCDSTPQISL